MTCQHNTSYDTVVSSKGHSHSLPQMIQNISLQNSPVTAVENQDYPSHNPSQPRDHILPAPELLSMMAAERGDMAPALYHTSYPTGISLQSNTLRDSLALHEGDFLTHSHTSHVDHSLARLRQSFQPMSTFQDYAASQGLTLLDEIADRTIDSTINGASAYSVAPGGAQALQPTLRKAHSLEELTSTGSPMSSYSRADPMNPCGGYHYASSSSSYAFSGSSLMPDSLSLQAHDDCGYLSSSAPSIPMSAYPGVFGLGGSAHAMASSAMYSSSFSKRILSPGISPSPSCHSPALSHYSPTLDMKRISLDQLSPSDSNDSDCHHHSILGNGDPKKRRRRMKNTKKDGEEDEDEEEDEEAEEEGQPLAQEKRIFVCKLNNCNRKFSRHYNLKSHKFTHGDQRPHACLHCPKTFARVHDRDRHMNSHMTEKPHVCIVCQSRFGRQDAVIRHLKLSNETNPCSWMLKQKGITFREAAAGRVPREQLGEETEIRQRLETLEEEARKIKATKTLESMNYSSGANTAAAAAGSWGGDVK
ncbi:hypothetical protein BGZ70_005036 [Mortierella alpina]|uniref:C2H2-type domain-containing protein n=1 Tax=Mortierella alpina TaxID=64518 RepID=A0A9P6J986_MORAP|nr:hypothetical protein BGZ70_005036 [Mortierella alpina]